MENKIRLRYAPSPTGLLHIGNTRTALFNYLFAKHYGGVFILRVENTDIKRNVSGAIRSQLDDLRWLGIYPDETIDKPGIYGPYSQLERLDIYRKYAFKLLKEKKAYYCFCTSEELEESRKKQLCNGSSSPKYDLKCYKLTIDEINNNLSINLPRSIRFHVPENEIYLFNDLVRGCIKFNSSDIGDWIILKSNNIPTYNFAVAIDDILMKISHIIRGEEHISNTPKQLMIYKALGEKEPVFAHLTLIVNKNHKKLSKRDTNLNQFISKYRDLGYLPEAIFNFVALLGWSPKNNNEIFSCDELIKIFNEKYWNKSPSMFDVKKLTWMNNLYIKKLDDDKYIKFVKPFLMSSYNLDDKSENWINILLLTYKKELKYGREIINLVKPFFVYKRNLSFRAKNVLDNLTNYQNLINLFKDKIINLDYWHENEINKIFLFLKKELKIDGKNLFMPIRIFVSYREHGPELSRLIYLLGKTIVINNINSLMDVMKMNKNEK